MSLRKLAVAAALTGCTAQTTPQEIATTSAPEIVHAYLYKDIQTITKLPDGSCSFVHPNTGLLQPKDQYWPVRFPQPIEEADRERYADMLPTVALLIQPPRLRKNGPTEAPEIRAFDTKQCTDGDESCTKYAGRSLDDYKDLWGETLETTTTPLGGSGSILSIEEKGGVKIATVLTAAHNFSLAFGQASHADVAIFNTSLDTPEQRLWKDVPTVEIGEQPYEYYLNREVEIIARFNGCDFNNQMYRVPFTLLGDSEKNYYYGASSHDADKFMGGVSGAPVMFEGKVIGVFTGISFSDIGLNLYRIEPIHKIRAAIQESQDAIADKRLPYFRLGVSTTSAQTP